MNEGLLALSNLCNNGSRVQLIQVLTNHPCWIRDVAVITQSRLALIHRGKVCLDWTESRWGRVAPDIERSLICNAIKCLAKCFTESESGLALLDKATMEVLTGLLKLVNAVSEIDTLKDNGAMQAFSIKLQCILAGS